MAAFIGDWEDAMESWHDAMLCVAAAGRALEAPSDDLAELTEPIDRLRSILSQECGPKEELYPRAGIVHSLRLTIDAIQRDLTLAGIRCSQEARDERTRCLTDIGARLFDASQMFRNGAPSSMVLVHLSRIAVAVNAAERRLHLLGTPSDPRHDPVPV